MERRRLDAEAPIDVFACVFWPKGRSGLLIEGDGFVEAIEDRMPRCRGVRVAHERLGAEGKAGRTSLYVVLEQERLRDIFAVLSADLVNAALTETSSAASLRRCVDRLCMWQGLFDRIAPEGLSEERQRGLFGELVVLETAFLDGADLLGGVAAWVGPTGAHQDFRRGGLAIEVKTSLAKRHARMTITNEKQLDERPHDPLLLASVRLDESGAGGASLPDLVSRTRAALANEEPAARLFDERLLQSDYFDVHAPLYEDRRWHVAAIRWYRVGGGFPRLTEANLPAGVGDISYSIVADDLGAWELVAGDAMELVGSAA